MKKNKFWNFVYQAFKFGITGAISTLISYGAYELFVWIGIHHLVANPLSFLVGTIFGYFANKLWVFSSKTKKYGNVWKFYAVYIFSFGYSQLMLWVLSDYAHLSVHIIPLLNLCFTIPFNFFMCKFWVFNMKRISLTPNHTFAVCAYKEGPYLEQCIQSLVNQTKQSKIIIETSTPNDYIYNIAKKYDIPVFVNEGESGLQNDWNYALSVCDTDFVTICHHDDYYKPEFYEQISAVIYSAIAKNTQMIHTAYVDVDGDGNESVLSNNKWKRRFLWVANFSPFQTIRPLKRLPLKLGSSICCPTCTYNKKKLESPIFHSELKDACDWDTYYEMTKKRGRMVYISKPLVAKRYHSGAQSNADLESGVRAKDDEIMFNKMWPKWIAKKLLKKYSKAYDMYK